MTHSEVAEAFASQWLRVSRAAQILKVDSAAVYRMAQRGDLDAVCEDGHWYVSVASVERMRRKRSAAAPAPDAA